MAPARGGGQSPTPISRTRPTAGCAPMGRRKQRDQGRPSCRCRGEAVPTGQDRNLESFAGVLIVARSQAVLRLRRRRCLDLVVVGV